MSETDQQLQSEENKEKMKSRRKQAALNAKESMETFGLFTESLKTLEQRLTELCTPAEDTDASLLQEEQKQELLRLYEDAEIKGELYRQSSGIKLMGTVTDFVGNISRMLKNDSSALLAYHPEKEILSMPEILGRGRSRVLEFSIDEAEKVQQILNQGLPFSYTDRSGSVQEGFFVPEKISDPQSAFEDMFRETDRTYPGYGDLYQRFYRNYVNNLNKRRDAAGQSRILPSDVSAMDFFAKEFGGRASLSVVFVSMKKHSFPGTESWGEAAPEGFREAYDLMKQKCLQFRQKYGPESETPEIRKEGRSASGSTAMSRTAALLGVPDLAVHAESMKILFDGQETDGTFISDAEGPDIAWKAGTGDAGPVFSGRGLRSAADLQVLDFLCGNIKRGAGNIRYLYHADGADPSARVITGVLGVDNEASFGEENLPVSDNETCLNLVNAMRVISQSMAEYVMVLAKNPAAVRYVLADCGFTGAQTDAALFRLDFLKKHIRQSVSYVSDSELREIWKDDLSLLPSGKLLILSEEEFTSFTPEKLSFHDPVRDTANLFFLISCSCDQPGLSDFYGKREAGASSENSRVSGDFRESPKYRSDLEAELFIRQVGRKIRELKDKENSC